MFQSAEVLRIARRSAGFSQRDLSAVAGRSVSTVSRIEDGSSEPAAALLAELLLACGWKLTALPIDPDHQPTQQNIPPTAPTTYDNPRNDDPFDSDTVHWLLTQPGVADTWTRGPLFECLRRQPGRVRNDAQRVEQAARLAARFGVEQRLVYDPTIGKQIIRLIRHDSDAPTYPW